MTFQEELEDYAEHSSRLIDESPQMDEENTKRKLIEPLLDVLGWDIVSSEVELEYPVPMGSGTKKVDYALILDDAPVVFVEAKGCDTNLTESHVEQLGSYMRIIGVDWGFLANGREFKIYRRDQNSARPNEITLAEFTLDEVVQHRNPLRALTKDSIERGESEQIAEKIEAVSRAVDTLVEEKEQIAERVTQVVTDAIGEAATQRVEDEAKNFVDDLVVSLTTQAQRNEGPEEPNGRGGPEGHDELGEEDYVIRVLRDGSELTEISAGTQNGAMAALVEYLIAEHDLLGRIELPYIPGTGRANRALLNTEPVHPNGVEMRRSKELRTGLYLFTNLSAKAKTRYLSELLSNVSLEGEFSNSW